MARTPIQIYRTPTPNNPPADGVLLDGELSIEQADPLRLWVGVGATKKLVVDATGAPWLPLAGGSLTGILNALPGITAGNIVTSGSLLMDTDPAGYQAAIFGRKNSAAYRWQLIIADTTPEAGGNAGSNFSIGRYSDAGTIIGTPLAISRATGVVDFEVAPTVAGVPLFATTKDIEMRITALEQRLAQLTER